MYSGRELAKLTGFEVQEGGERVVRKVDGSGFGVEDIVDCVLLCELGDVGDESEKKGLGALRQHRLLRAGDNKG